MKSKRMKFRKMQKDNTAQVSIILAILAVIIIIVLAWTIISQLQRSGGHETTVYITAYKGYKGVDYDGTYWVTLKDHDASGPFGQVMSSDSQKHYEHKGSKTYDHDVYNADWELYIDSTEWTNWFDMDDSFHTYDSTETITITIIIPKSGGPEDVDDDDITILVS